MCVPKNSALLLVLQEIRINDRSPLKLNQEL